MLASFADTGAEFNLVRKGLLAPSEFKPSRTPLSLVTADGTKMEGGAMEVTLKLCFALPPNEENKVEWCTQGTFHDADLQVDAILVVFLWGTPPLPDRQVPAARARR